MEPKYLPVSERTPDTQYRESLGKILENGEYTKNPFQTMGTYTLLTLAPMVFLLSNGFPIITERKIGFWRKPIAELLAFINGARTGDELAKWGCDWWGKQWATPEKCAQFGLPPGDLGPGSYGAAFHDFPMIDGGSFNQFEHLVKQIKEYPSIRTHVVSPWIPQYALGHKDLQRQVVVAPCHGWIQITVINGKLTLRMDQRSADFPIGVPSNIIQYAALTIMVAHVTGNEPHMYIHATHDAQVYEDQVDPMWDLLKREPRVFPSLHLTREGRKVTDLFEFRPEHFELCDYDPHPGIAGIPVTT